MRLLGSLLILVPAIFLTGCIVESPRRPPPAAVEYDRRPPPPEFDRRPPPPDFDRGPPPRGY